MEKNVVKNSMQTIIDERIKSNVKLFTLEEKDMISKNKTIVNKIYMLGLLDGIISL